MNLNGAWKLVEYLVELEDGRTVKPWGDDFLGYAVVSEGFMCSSMIKTKVENNIAKDSFFSYSGSFEVIDNTISIQVVLCSEPSWVGGVQERKFELVGDRLSVITPDLEWDGIKGINTLTWKRVNR